MRRLSNAVAGQCGGVRGYCSARVAQGPGGEPCHSRVPATSQPARTLVTEAAHVSDEEDHVSITNADVADRAIELASEPGGLRRWAALCVGFAAAITGTVISAQEVLEVIPLPDLRGAAQSLLAELVEDPATAGRAAAMPRHARVP
jgi:hypothetical protein